MRWTQSEEKHHIEDERLYKMDLNPPPQERERERRRRRRRRGAEIAQTV
jgi:hypothetical protein